MISSLNCVYLADEFHQSSDVEVWRLRSTLSSPLVRRTAFQMSATELLRSPLPAVEQCRRTSRRRAP